MNEPTLREALDATWRLPEDAPTERHNRAWYEAGWAERAEAIRQRFRSVPARPEDAALARADDGLDVERMARAAEKVGLRMAVEWWREVAAEYAAEQGEQGR